MKRILMIKIVLGCLFLACLYAATISDAQQAQTKAKPRTEETASRSSATGEERFQTNCGRCHNAPEDLSPREARATEALRLLEQRYPSGPAAASAAESRGARLEPLLAVAGPRPLEVASPEP